MLKEKKCSSFVVLLFLGLSLIHKQQVSLLFSRLTWEFLRVSSPANDVHRDNLCLYFFSYLIRNPLEKKNPILIMVCI